MRWNQFGNDPVKASALGDVLLGAAMAGRQLTETKLAVVHGQVAKVMGASVLPDEVVAHMQLFEPLRFDLGSACKRLGLEGPRDRIALMKAVSVVIHAEGAVLPEERAYALRVATQLGVPWNEVLDLVGMPSRPSTGPRPRPVPRQQ